MSFANIERGHPIVRFGCSQQVSSWGFQIKCAETNKNIEFLYCINNEIGATTYGRTDTANTLRTGSVEFQYMNPSTTQNSNMQLEKGNARLLLNLHKAFQHIQKIFVQFHYLGLQISDWSTDI